MTVKSESKRIAINWQVAVEAHPSVQNLIWLPIGSLFLL